jgi:DnaK suppressor protein
LDEKLLEMAEALTAAITESNVTKICSKVKARDPLFDGNCEDCSEPIPEARLNTGATLCLECKQYQEQQEAHFRR